ncbi:MAG: hypothetical protein HW386_298 [Gammaproteobacteria bacterium]|nr:hypothetical protein [Gammaproteobacteria bacterium]
MANLKKQSIMLRRHLKIFCCLSLLLMITGIRSVVWAQADSAAGSDAQQISADNNQAADINPAVSGVIDADSDNELEKDIILVLDNSGSMRQNDPGFLAKQVVTEFISGLDESTRLAIIVFDQDVSLVVPLTQVNLANRDVLLVSLDRVTYRGLFTDSPAAMERAIYELKNNGSGTAQKLIVFMTDGIVDTGNAEQDLDKSKWLRESLAPDAADAGIRIFGIAFTEDADFRLIQSLAQESGGEYYRALQAEDLGHVFEQIHTIIQEPPKAVSSAEPQSASAPAPPPQVIIEVPAQSVPAMDREERIRSMIMIVAAAMLILAVLAILILLLRRSHGAGATVAGDEFVTEAYLNDIHGHTAQSSYKLGKKPTMLGRVAGMDTEHLDYFVIPQSTIGRRHSLIEYKDYAYWIVDQGSINGTFVNDVPITSEVRLKHGDKVRLHKFEFEFAMPEMVDAGMTVVSQTMLAAQSPDEAEATEMKGAGFAADNKFDLNFDLGSESMANAQASKDARQAAEDASQDMDSEEETLIPGYESRTPAKAELPEEQEAYVMEDETLMPGHDSEAKTPPHGTPAPQPLAAAPPENNADKEDETLMPGNFNLPEEDATIRKDAVEDKSFDNFFDIGGIDKDNDK